jgi:hypothetical protein
VLQGEAMNSTMPLEKLYMALLILVLDRAAAANFSKREDDGSVHCLFPARPGPEKESFCPALVS